MKITRTKVAVLIVSWAVATLAMFGCGASGQLEPQLAPRVVREAEKCLQDGPCFMLHVTNDGTYRVTVSVNGWKIGEVEGNHSDSFPVSEAKLRHGRCAAVAFWVIGPGSRLSSDEQCIREGGYFTAQLDVQYHALLTSWGGS